MKTYSDVLWRPFTVIISLKSLHKPLKRFKLQFYVETSCCMLHFITSVWKNHSIFFFFFFFHILLLPLYESTYKMAKFMFVFVAMIANDWFDSLLFYINFELNRGRHRRIDIEFRSMSGSPIMWGCTPHKSYAMTTETS